MSVEELPAPVAGPEEVVVEVDSAGICGTDLHIYLDEFETAPPVTIGHEFAGRIVETGKVFKTGIRVNASLREPIFPPVVIADIAVEAVRTFASSANPSARSETVLLLATSSSQRRICIASRTKSISRVPPSQNRWPVQFTEF